MSIFSDVNELTLCRDDYDNQCDFENAIRHAVMLLLNANYVMVIDYFEKELGIVTIQYCASDEELGCRYPRWLLPEEFESVVYRDEEK